MNVPLARRLIALEQALHARRVVYQVYTTRAEAEAASDPLGGAATVVQIITGVPRSPACCLDRQ